MFSEIQTKLSAITKKDKENSKSNYNLLVTKLQQGLNKICMLEDVKKMLEEDNANKKIEIGNLHTETSELVGRVRDLTVAHHTLKLKLQKYEPSVSTQAESVQSINAEKDNEIRDLRRKVEAQEQELRQLREIGFASNEYSKLELEHKELKKELEQNRRDLEDLVDQLRSLQEVKRIEKLAEGPSLMVDETNEGTSHKRTSTGKQLSSPDVLVRKPSEFENLKRKLTDENIKLSAENRNYLKEVKFAQLKYEDVETKLRVAQSRIALLEKDQESKINTIRSRTQHTDSLTRERQELSDELVRVRQRESQNREQRIQLEAKLKFYEEYNSRLTSNNRDLLADKQAYLKSLLTRQKEILEADNRNNEEKNKLIQENAQLRNEVATHKTSRIVDSKKSEDQAFLLKMKSENQDIVITSLMRKIEVQESIVSELSLRLTELTNKQDGNLKEDLDVLADMNSILFKSSLSIEDYKNLESLKELLHRQKNQYEDTLKALLQSHEDISQKFFGLEEKYRKEQESADERTVDLTSQMTTSTANYEKKLKELEEKIQELELAKAKQAGEGESQQQGDSMVLEGGVAMSTSELEELRQDLDSERRKITDLERKLLDADSKVKALENEKLELTRSKHQIQAAVSSGQGSFQMRELSWHEQKRVLGEQLDSYGKDSKLRDELKSLTEGSMAQGPESRTQMEEETASRVRMETEGEQRSSVLMLTPCTR